LKGEKNCFAVTIVGLAKKNYRTGNASRKRGCTLNKI